jgi:hypothetical protein
LHPVTKEFARALVDRLQDGKREFEWADITTLLNEERFAALRDCSFVPSSHPDVLISVRINDRFDFPLHRDGYAGFHKRLRP